MQEWPPVPAPGGLLKDSEDGDDQSGSQ
jgi:hypothetical protein